MGVLTRLATAERYHATSTSCRPTRAANARRAEWAFSLCGGGFLLCGAPLGGGFEGDVSARADRCFTRSALLSFQLGVHADAEPVRCAEFADRVPSGGCRRAADRRCLGLGRRFRFTLGRRLNRLRVRARRFGLLLRLIVRLCRLFGIRRRFGGTG